MNIIKKLWEREISSDLIAKNFEILNFYGKESGFIWNDNHLASFTYDSSTSSDDEIQIINDNSENSMVIASPRSIKSICSYSGRVFIVCEPTGIYKLTDKYKFSLLSDSGIGLATEFHHVLTCKKDYLHLCDKVSKKSTPLFRLHQYENEDHSISTNSTINSDSSKVSINNYDNDNEKVCLISNGKKLFKLTDDYVRIIYYFDDLINQICLIKNNRTIGYAALTDANYILILLIDKSDKLIESRKIHYDGIIKTLTFHCNSDKLIILHSNGNNINCKLININTLDVNDDVKIFNDFSNVNSLKNYNNKIHMLSCGNKLTLFDIADDKIIINKDDDEFYELSKDMIKGTHIIVDRICERAKELEIINKNIELLKNKIQRINVYAHNQLTEYSPVIDIVKIIDCNYLTMKFSSLPINTKIIGSIKIGRQRIFSSKNVHDSVTVLELPMLVNNIEELIQLDLRIHLITDYCDKQIWCILNNFSRNSGNLRGGEGEEAVDRANFLNAKLMTLRNLVEEGNIDGVKLLNIKKSVRKGVS